MALRDLIALRLEPPLMSAVVKHPVLSPRDLVSQDRTYGVLSADECEIKNRSENGGIFKKNPVKCIFLSVDFAHLEASTTSN